MKDCKTQCQYGFKKQRWYDSARCLRCREFDLKEAEAKVCKLLKENTLLLWEKDIDDPYQAIRKLLDENVRLTLENAHGSRVLDDRNAEIANLKPLEEDIAAYWKGDK